LVTILVTGVGVAPGEEDDEELGEDEEAELWRRMSLP
jgi:hypothetical protein